MVLIYYNGSFNKTDYENLFIYIFNLRDQSIFDVWVANSYIKLLQPFDPTNSGKDSLAAGTRALLESIWYRIFFQATATFYLQYFNPFWWLLCRW